MCVQTHLSGRGQDSLDIVISVCDVLDIGRRIELSRSTVAVRILSRHQAKQNIFITAGEISYGGRKQLSEEVYVFYICIPRSANSAKTRCARYGMLLTILRGGVVIVVGEVDLSSYL